MATLVLLMVRVLQVVQRVVVPLAVPMVSLVMLMVRASQVMRRVTR